MNFKLSQLTAPGKPAARNVALGVSGLAILVGAVTGCGNSTAKTAAASSAAGVQAAAAGHPAAAQASPKPAQAAGQGSKPAPAKTPGPAAPAMTPAQKQAVDAVSGYLRYGQGFSKAGLIQQLTSSAGNGFTRADAEFAVSHISVNWDQQAAEAAKGYLSDEPGFSKAYLIQQLTSSDGNGFTREQAEFAVSHVSVNWDQQAVDSAKGYLSQEQGFSKAGLLQQLTSSDGDSFTRAQAEYAVSHVSVNWDQQAARAAKSYMSLGEGYSYSSLVQQLESSFGSGFTAAQAQYGAHSVGLNP